MFSHKTAPKLTAAGLTRFYVIIITKTFDFLRKLIVSGGKILSMEVTRFTYQLEKNYSQVHEFHMEM
jgi:hypothetical protein